MCRALAGPALGDHLKHTPIVQGDGANAAEYFPIVHTIFSNIKAWLVGTHHGVSAKHLPRYLREWEYRFNRRNLSGGPALWLIRRAVDCATITYDQIAVLIGMTTRTVRFHITNARAKLGATSRSHLAALAIAQGIANI